MIKEYVKRDDWAPKVKLALNQLIEKYKNDNNYVVFDFDNTCSIFDIEHQLCIYQLEHMAFNLKPNELEDALLSDLKHVELYTDWIIDITNSYNYLYETYGPFDGNEKENYKEIQKDIMWMEFATKMRAFYKFSDSNERPDIGCLFPLKWFTNMTIKQVYNLATNSHSYYSKVESSKVLWESPNIPSKIGKISFTWDCGINVTENIKELIKAFSDNNIDVYVCSASGTTPVQAAIDYFGLHNYVKGMTGVNLSKKDGVFKSRFDEESSWYLSKEDGAWEKDKTVLELCPIVYGKRDAIVKGLMPKYKKGPIAAFMDSLGDFNFATEFNNLKLVVCFNRLREVTDGGGLISEVALYEDYLGYDLEKANENNDTYYVLQGRDENGLRTLRNSPKTVVYGEVDEKLLCNIDNQNELNLMIEKKMKVKEIFDTFYTHFLPYYDGYHNIK